MGNIRQEASDLFNSLPDEDRKKAGLGYSLAQLTTIRQQRSANKDMIAREDRRLADWAKRDSPRVDALRHNPRPYQRER